MVLRPVEAGAGQPRIPGAPRTARSSDSSFNEAGAGQPRIQNFQDARDSGTGVSMKPGLANPGYASAGSLGGKIAIGASMKPGLANPGYDLALPVDAQARRALQ